MCSVHRTLPNLIMSPLCMPYRPPGEMATDPVSCTRNVCEYSHAGQCNDVLNYNTGL